RVHRSRRTRSRRGRAVSSGEIVSGRSAPAAQFRKRFPFSRRAGEGGAERRMSAPRTSARMRVSGALTGPSDTLSRGGGRGCGDFEVIASLDLLNGNVVRLRRGAFDDVTTYGDPATVLQRLNIPKGARLHVVDLDGSRSGAPRELATIARLNGYRLQVGGGIRSAADARAWLNAGAQKVVI